MNDDLKLKQMHELLQGHLARRKIEPGVLDYKTVEKAAGQAAKVADIGGRRRIGGAHPVHNAQEREGCQGVITICDRSSGRP